MSDLTIEDCIFRGYQDNITLLPNFGSVTNFKLRRSVVADAYGAWGERSMYGRKFMGIVRSAFLVDEQGNLAEVWPKISPKDTPTKLLAALEG